MKKVALTSLVLGLLILVTIGVVLYGRGYRFSFDNGRADLAGTGLLVATSSPDGAQVFINDHLTTATDNTINLSPGEYNVRIVKKDFFHGRKNHN